MQPTVTPAGKYGPKHAADSEFVARKVAAFRAGAGPIDACAQPASPPSAASSDSDAYDECDSTAESASDSGDLAAALECVELTC